MLGRKKKSGLLSTNGYRTAKTVREEAKRKKKGKKLKKKKSRNPRVLYTELVK